MSITRPSRPASGAGGQAMGEGDGGRAGVTVDVATVAAAGPTASVGPVPGTPTRRSAGYPGLRLGPRPGPGAGYPLAGTGRRVPACGWGGVGAGWGPGAPFGGPGTAAGGTIGVAAGEVAAGAFRSNEAGALAAGAGGVGSAGRSRPASRAL